MPHLRMRTKRLGTERRPDRPANTPYQRHETPKPAPAPHPPKDTK
jgi:hypothetical protein